MSPEADVLAAATLSKGPEATTVAGVERRRRSGENTSLVLVSLTRNRLVRTTFELSQTHSFVEILVH